MIKYDDFAKLEVTIGEILSVEVVEGADKLLKLMVDFGPKQTTEGEEVAAALPAKQEEQPQQDEEQLERDVRQIVSGIREYFDDPQELVGKRCPFVTNLEPRTIRGLESQGMIVAAHSEDAFALLVPHRELPAGARVI